MVNKMSVGKNFVFMLIALFLCILVGNEISKVASVTRIGEEYVENLEDEKIGDIVRVYPNAEAKLDREYFVLNSKGQAFLVHLETKDTSVLFTHDSTLINESDEQLNEMLEKSVRNDN